MTLSQDSSTSIPETIKEKSMTGEYLDAAVDRFVGMDQWEIINRTIDRYNAGKISELVALGIIGTHFMVIDKMRVLLFGQGEGV